MYNLGSKQMGRRRQLRIQCLKNRIKGVANQNPMIPHPSMVVSIQE